MNFYNNYLITIYAKVLKKKAFLLEKLHLKSYNLEVTEIKFYNFKSNN